VKLLLELHTQRKTSKNDQIDSTVISKVLQSIYVDCYVLAGIQSWTRNFRFAEIRDYEGVISYTTG
jgi:hypothetical protein